MTIPLSVPGRIPTLKLRGGDDWSLTLTLKQGGVPVDLVAAGWTGWRAQWRPAAGSATVLAIDVNTTSAASGVLVLSMDGARTGQMGGPGVWDLEAKDSSDRTVTWCEGDTAWEQDVTR